MDARGRHAAGTELSPVLDQTQPRQGLCERRVKEEERREERKEKGKGRSLGATHLPFQVVTCNCETCNGKVMISIIMLSQQY